MVTGAHGKNTSGELVINSCGTGGDVIIDSGCSRHVCGRTFRDKLTNWRTGPSIRVRVANGHTHVSSEYATLPITVKTDDGPRKIIIGEVLYVEEITNLLLSVGAMTAKGIDFTMSKDTMRMDLPNTSITIRKSPGENLYRLSVLSEASDNRVHLNDPSFSVMEQSAFGFRSTSEQIRIWHDSLGHIGQKTFIRLMKSGKTPNFRMNEIKRVISECDACSRAKARAHPVPKSSDYTATEPFERIHCDAVMITHPTIGGKKGFSLIVDEFTKLVDVRIIAKKNETQDHIKDFVLRMDALGHCVKKLRTDSAAQFAKDVEFKRWLTENRIGQENSAPYAQYQNGIVERHIQTIEDRAAAILLRSGLPKGFWGEAMLCAAATWNVTANNDVSPYEMVTGCEADLSTLKPFGCRVYVRKPIEMQQHMEERAIPAIFIGYSSETKGYKIVKDESLKSCIIRAPRDCTFNEDVFPQLGPKSRGDRSEDILHPNFWTILLIPDGMEPPTGAPSASSTPSDDQSPSREDHRPSTPPLVLDDQYFPSTFQREVTLHPRNGLRSGRNHHAGLLEEAINAIDAEVLSERCGIDDMVMERLDTPEIGKGLPKSIKEALADPIAKRAAETEIEMITKFQTWELVPITDVPAGKSVYSPIWRFSRKLDRRIKARLCFPGHRQRQGVDYSNVTSPTVAMASFRLFLTICKYRGSIPTHLDIRNAYLHATVKEDIYMKQPPGFVDPGRPNDVCKLKKALYGLHQAGFNWHELIDGELQKFGLKRSEHDPCVYHLHDGNGKWVIICLYVDDLLIGGDAMTKERIIIHLKTKFSVSAEGDVKRYLGINVTTGDGPWKLDQADDILSFLKSQGMETARPVDRPGDPNLRHEDVVTRTMVNQALYWTVIGNLLWFAITTRPDIIYAVNVVAQFQQNPTSMAWNATKRIMKYLVKTSAMGITINPRDMQLSVYSDANHGDAALGDRLSVSGGAFSPDG